MTIWWSGPSNAEALRNTVYRFIPIAPKSTLTRSGSIWKGPIVGFNRTIVNLNWDSRETDLLEVELLDDLTV